MYDENTITMVGQSETLLQPIIGNRLLKTVKFRAAMNHIAFADVLISENRISFSIARDVIMIG